MIKICLNCHKEFKAWNKNSKFCSCSCSMKWRLKHEPDLEKKRIEGRWANKKIKIDKAKVIDLYIIQNLKRKEVANLLKVKENTLKLRLKEWKIKKSKELKRKIKRLPRPPKWHKEDCIRKYKEIIKESGEYLDSKQLEKKGYEALRHAIFRRFGNFPNFLKEVGIKIPSLKELKEKYDRKRRLTRQENFRLYSSKMGKKPNRDPNYYNSMELEVKEVLEDIFSLKEKIDFKHNWKILRYCLDFYIPKLNLDIERDSIWHHLGDTEIKDKRRDIILESLGIKTIRIPPEIREKKEVANLLLPYLKDNR